MDNTVPLSVYQKDDEVDETVYLSGYLEDEVDETVYLIGFLEDEVFETVSFSGYLEDGRRDFLCKWLPGR